MNSTATSSLLRWLRLSSLPPNIGSDLGPDLPTQFRLAVALESYRREHGFYLESKSEATLIDHLNPHYLARVIRVDPWHQPYEYEGTRDGFTLRSVGPDGKSNTADDIFLPGGSR
ncbi:MAG: hypothetical protein DMF74_09035 [Acidobacteria bacterium]|nr:MAG: hypothetical protein DMF74_09035 [Acidobacteriota bacterium]